MINVVDGGERITTKIPDAFRNLLATATAEQIEVWARDWSTSDLDWPESDCLEIAKSLQSLAKYAQADDKPLYLWNCV